MDKKIMPHLVESQQFDRRLLKKIFKTADRLEYKRKLVLRGKIMASLFYEPSTRTRFSFESAMLRLGGSVISTENAREFSSAAKGETLEDSIRVISRYADVIVMRHNEIGAARRAAAVATVPVINAGDGAGQHPTQGLLDLYTIKRELGKISGTQIAMVGDLKHGRTIHSLAYLLGKYKRIAIYFVSPPELKVGQDIESYLQRHHITYHETADLGAVISQADVVYQTRIQQERFTSPEDYQRLKGIYRITPTLAKKMKIGAIIMHPLPRVDEIDPTVDELPQARYFQQAYYGFLIRMALLKLFVSDREQLSQLLFTD